MENILNENLYTLTIQYKEHLYTDDNGVKIYRSFISTQEYIEKFLAFDNIEFFNKIGNDNMGYYLFWKFSN